MAFLNPYSWKELYHKNTRSNFQHLFANAGGHLKSWSLNQNKLGEAWTYQTRSVSLTTREFLSSYVKNQKSREKFPQCLVITLENLAQSAANQSARILL